MLTPGAGETFAEAVGKAAKAFDGGPLAFIGHYDDDDAYYRGPEVGGTLYVVPGLWTSMPTDLLSALRSRRRASITGRCPNCDAVVDLAAGEVRHKPSCAVCDANLRPLLAAWHRRVGRFARGRRIVEDPA